MEQNILVLNLKIAYNTYMNIIYKSNNKVVYSCKYHVVWCPKYKRIILTNGIDTRLRELFLKYAVNISVDIGDAMLDVIKQYIENQKTSQRQKDKLG